MLVQRAQEGPVSDVRARPGFLAMAARGAPLRLVLAEAEFGSQPNHEFIRQRLGAQSIIPAKRGGVPNGSMRNQMFRALTKKPIANALRSKPTSRPSSANSPRALPVADRPSRSAKPSCSVLPTTSTG